MSDSTKHHLRPFIERFAGHGRTDCFSLFDVKAGKGYRFADEEVSRDVLAAHLSGEQPIAIYLFKGETTRLAAFDIDNHGGELDGGQVAARTLPLIHDLRSRGITPFSVRSGGGAGLHIWLIWREPQNCRNLRRLLTRILRKHGFKPGTGGIAKSEIEIYPKQDAVGPDKLGNPLALPFSRRSVALDHNLVPLPLGDYAPPSMDDLYAPGLSAIPGDDLPPDERPGPSRRPSPTDQLHKGDEAEAKSALRHIPADSYDEWIRIGFVLKHSFGEAGFDLWDDWSRSSQKYSGTTQCREVWAGFEPDGSVSLGTLFYMAQQRGWNGPSDPEIREMNAKYGIITQGSKTLIVEKQLDADEDRPFVYITKEVLKDRYRSRTVLIPQSNGAPLSYSLADYWLGHSKSDQYKRYDFDPGQPPGRNGNTYNIWSGFAVQAMPGDWSILREHIAENICNGDPELDGWLLNWLAIGVQQLGKVVGTAPVLAGLPGVGKGILAHSYGSIWGRHYTTITQESHVGGRFNFHLMGRGFVFIDEGTWGGNRQDAGTIKTRITEPYIMLEAKGVDPVRIRNRTNYMVASNAASIVPADIADRRWQMFEVNDRRRGDKAYFSALAQQFDSGGREGMLYDLLNRDVLSGPDPRQTIKTAGLFEQVLRAQGPEFRYIFQILDEGLLPQPNAPRNGPRATTIRAMYEEMRATQPNAPYVPMRSFGRIVNAMIPGIQSTQSGVFIERSGATIAQSRSTRYTFPPLLTCRSHFEARAGQRVPWSNELQEWQYGIVEKDEEEPAF